MKKKSQEGSILAIFAIAVTISLIITVGLVLWQNISFQAPKDVSKDIIDESTDQGAPTEAYKGETITLADTLTVKVPNGWSAKRTTAASGLQLIMFAGPNELPNLTYKPEQKPTISTIDGFGWDGLTQHFYITAPQTEEAKFVAQPNDQASVFTLNDKTEGTRYLRTIKPSGDEFSSLPDGFSDWQGRTYILTKNDKTVEAHLAVFLPTSLDIAFFESVIKSIKIK